MPSRQEIAFDAATWDIYRRANEIGYGAGDFRKLITNRGGVEAARYLLDQEKISTGYTTLWEKQRLDLSVEALVLRPEWDGLFTDAQRAEARRRLVRDLGTRELSAEEAAELGPVLGLRSSGGVPIARKGATPQLDEVERIAIEESTKGAFEAKAPPNARERVLRSIEIRRGQPEFRNALLRAYGGRCAISDCDATDALEACHILAYSKYGADEVTNGLLLRGDLHSLFDLGLLAVDPKRRTVIVHAELARTVYGQLEGQPIREPADERLRPSTDALRRHLVEAGLQAREMPDEAS